MAPAQLPPGVLGGPFDGRPLEVENAGLRLPSSSRPLSSKLVGDGPGQRATAPSGVRSRRHRPPRSKGKIPLLQARQEAGGCGGSKPASPCSRRGACGASGIGGAAAGRAGHRGSRRDRGFSDQVVLDRLGSDPVRDRADLELVVPEEVRLALWRHRFLRQLRRFRRRWPRGWPRPRSSTPYPLSDRCGADGIFEQQIRSRCGVPLRPRHSRLPNCKRIHRPRDGHRSPRREGFSLTGHSAAMMGRYSPGGDFHR